MVYLLGIVLTLILVPGIHSAGDNQIPVMDGNNKELRMDTSDAGGSGSTDNMTGAGAKSLSYSFGEPVVSGGPDTQKFTASGKNLAAGFYAPDPGPAKITSLAATSSVHARWITLTWTVPGSYDDARELLNVNTTTHTYYIEIASVTNATQNPNWRGFEFTTIKIATGTPITSGNQSVVVVKSTACRSHSWLEQYDLDYIDTNGYSTAWAHYPGTTGNPTRLWAPPSDPTTYYFRIWTVDNTGEPSPVSDTSVSYYTWVPVLNVDIADSYNFGTLNTGVDELSTSGLPITNNGNVESIYSLHANNSTKWTTDGSATPGVDRFVLRGIIHGVSPVTGDFVNNDILSNSTTESSNSVFVIDTSTLTHTGQFVSPVPYLTSGNYPNKRSAWFKVSVPYASSTPNEQSIGVVVTAAEDTYPPAPP